MADSKISTFPTVGTVDGSEDLAGIKAGANVRVPVDTMVANLDLVKVHRTGGVPDYLMDSDANQLTVVNAAPKSAEFITYAANATLTGERVLTASTSITLDTATAGQIIPKSAAITGDVTIAANSTTATIPNDKITTAMLQANAVTSVKVVDSAITNAKLANMAPATVKCNPESSSGVAKDSTLSGGLSVVAGSPGVLQSKGSIAFPYIWNTSVAGGDPGNTKMAANHATFASITSINISKTNAKSTNIAAYLASAVGKQIEMMSNNESSNAYGNLTITGATDNTTYWTYAVTPGAGVLPANNENILFKLSQGASGAGLSTQDVLNMGVVRQDVDGFLIDPLDNIISGSPTVADFDALFALAPVDYDGFAVNVQSGAFNSFWSSNGTSFGPLNGQYIAGVSLAPSNRVVWPADVTWTASDNGSGKVRLTSSAAHGIAEVDAEGSDLYLISGGTGWTAGTKHRINATSGYVSTTQLDLDTNYTASMGVPVFAKSSNTVTEAVCEAPLLDITLPRLRQYTRVKIECAYEFNSKADTTQRRCMMYLGTTQYYNFNVTATGVVSTPFTWGFKNQGVTNSQRGLYASNSNGFSNGASAPATTTLDTSVDGTVLSLRFMTAVPGITARVAWYTLTIEG